MSREACDPQAVQGESGSATPRASLCHRLLCPGNVVSPEPFNHVPPEGHLRSQRRPDSHVLLDHGHPLADQAGLWSHLGFRPAVRSKAEELFSLDLRDRRSNGSHPHHDGIIYLLGCSHLFHPDGARSCLHRRADRRPHGGERPEARSHRAIPGDPMGRNLVRVDFSRDRRRLARPA